MLGYFSCAEALGERQPREGFEHPRFALGRPVAEKRRAGHAMEIEAAMSREVLDARREVGHCGAGRQVVTDPLRGREVAPGDLPRELSIDHGEAQRGQRAERGHDDRGAPEERGLESHVVPRKQTRRLAEADGRQHVHGGEGPHDVTVEMSAQEPVGGEKEEQRRHRESPDP
jgi:hypothetical protein